MAEKLEDLNLPQASVLRIIKDSLPENVTIVKDVKAALAKAASMFILYITSQSIQVSQNAKRKTLLPQDVLDALEEADFGEYVEPIKKALKGDTGRATRAHFINHIFTLRKQRIQRVEKR